MHTNRPRARIVFLGILLSLANMPVQAGWPPIFRGPELYNVGNWPTGASTRGGLPAGIASGDLDGDGLPDLVVSNNRAFDFSGPGNTVSVLIHYADFTSPVLFQPKSNYRACTAPAGLSIADMNRDGNMDVVVSSDGADSVAVLLGNGTGALGAPTVYSVPRTSVAGLKVTDVNADGWPDVVLARDNVVPEGISVMLGTGGGALGPPVGYASGLPSTALISFLATGDVTGDGIVDVVGADAQAGYGVVVFQGNNTGAFTAIGTFPDAPNTNLLDIEIARLNTDAIPDLVVSRMGLSGQKGVAVLIGTGGGSFMPYVLYPTTHDVGEISLADVDKDGRVDVVASGVGLMDNTVTLLHGNGDGTFGAPTYYVATQGLYRSTLADVNMDGWPDLVAPVYTLAFTPLAHTVAVLLGDGAGGFLAGTENLQGRKPFREAIADFNRDGKLDVIASDSLGVTVGLGNGDGTFATLSKMNLPFHPGTILVADWNRDGKADFAVQRGTSQVEGYIGVGNGTFAPTPYFSLIGYVIFPRSVTDMNRDGRPDLVVNLVPSNSVAVLTQNSGGTTFTMTGPAAAMSGTVQSLATGDWNRDGNPDVAVATNIGIDMSLGTGGGAISAFPNNLIGGRSYRDVCAGDFNRDGVLDLAGIEAAAGQTGRRGIDMMFGNGAGFFSSPTSFTTLEQNGYRIESWDANADGAPDIITSQLNDTNEFVPQTVLASMEVLLNNGNGTFGYAVAHHLGLSYLSPVTSPYFASGDVTGDGLPDLLSASLTSVTPTYALETLRSIAPVRGAELNPRVDYSVPQASRVAIGDLNRDGIPDVVSGSPTTPGVAVRLGDEFGGLGSSTTVSQSLGVRQVGLADFNGDGVLDLVTSRTGLGVPDVVSCMLGVGDGTFGPRLDNPTVNVLDFAIADMNRDGRLDLVVGQPDAGGSFIRVLLGNGDGTFTPQAATSVPWVYDLDTADVNRDGIPDVVVAGGVLSVLYGNGDGTLSSSTQVPVGTTNLQSICVADFDRDGYSDIATTDLSGHIIVGWGSAVPPLSSYVTSSLPFSAWDVQVGAAKVDGQPYLYLSTLSNQVAILKQGTPGVFTILGTYPTGTDPEALALADLNRDGAPDVVTANSSSGNISVFLHGAKIVTGIETERVSAPPIRLWQNYPNPFNPITTIRFALDRADRVRLNVFDVQGRPVTTLVDEVMAAGKHSVIWRGKTDGGAPVASGVYFYRLSTASGSEESRRMVLLK